MGVARASRWLILWEPFVYLPRARVRMLLVRAPMTSALVAEVVPVTPPGPATTYHSLAECQTATKNATLPKRFVSSPMHSFRN
jgi:hypothetical protein